MDRPAWSSLLAHRHSIGVGHGRWEIRLCARCAGLVTGFALLALSATVLDYTTLFLSLLSWQQIILGISLALPAMVDWLTQAWGLRESTNPLRLGTGIIEGLGVCVVAFSSSPFAVKLLLVSSIVGLVMLIGYAGKSGRGRLDRRPKTCMAVLGRDS